MAAQRPKTGRRGACKIRDNTGLSGVNCIVHLPASAHAQGGLEETLSRSSASVTLSAL